MLKRKHTSQRKMWQSMPWRAVDATDAKFDASDAMFFGLEELDGNAYKLSKTEKGYNLDVGEGFSAEPSAPAEAAAADDVDGDGADREGDDEGGGNASSAATLTAKQLKKLKRKEKMERLVQKKRQKRKEKYEATHGAGAGDGADDGDGDGDGAVAEEEEEEEVEEMDGGMEDEQEEEGDVLGYDDRLVPWGAGGDTATAAPVPVHHLIHHALTTLNYHTPTAIQRQGIPATLENNPQTDIVGAAETGSGKTLAFILPIMQSLLLQYQDWHSDAYINDFKRNIFALIIAPTRELALQIAHVATDVSKHFYSIDSNTAGGLKGKKTSSSSSNGSSSGAFLDEEHDIYCRRHIGIMTITGGLSEHKQKRQLHNGLYGKNPKQFVHIVVATPGRLCEMLKESNKSGGVFGQEAEVPTVTDGVNHDIDVREIVESEMTREEGNEIRLLARQHWRDLRFLVVDEADRLIEEGHFPELHRILDFIQPTVAAVNTDGEELEEENNKEAAGEGGGKRTTKKGRRGGDGDDDEEPSAPVVIPSNRQTLLYSATSIANTGSQHALHVTNTAKSTLKALRKHKKTSMRIVDVDGKTGKLENLASTIQNLLLLTAKRGTVVVVDVTAASHRRKTLGNGDPASAHAASDPATHTATADGLMSGDGNALTQSLPAQLVQYEVQVPKEEKDLQLVHILLQNRGRVLVFVNSIKSARKVDGLLHALGFHHSRVVHSQMQQRQRLNAIDSFTNTSTGILIATDVAARGLDIANIQLVVHYDIARTPQIYVHRSGRTARGNCGKGATLSIVTPMDHGHYTAICKAMAISKFATYTGPLIQELEGEGGPAASTDALSDAAGVNAATAPVLPHDMEVLAEAVKLAKEVFHATFLSNHEAKQSSWLKKLSEETDLMLENADDTDSKGRVKTKMASDANDEEDDVAVTNLSNKDVQIKKSRLQRLVAAKFQKTVNQNSRFTSAAAAAAAVNPRSLRVKPGKKPTLKLSKHKMEKQQLLAQRSWKKDRCSVVVAR